MTNAADTSEIKPSFKITRGWLIRFFGSLAILAVLFWYLPMDEVLASFSRISWTVFMSVLTLFMIGHVFAAGKWWILLEKGFDFTRALRAHFAGLAANLCLPGVAGGDVVRAGLVTRFTELSKLTAASLSDRLIDMLALGLVSVSGLLMLQTNVENGALTAQVIGLFIIALVSVFYVLPAVLPKLLSVFPKLPARKFLLNISTEFASLARRPGSLIMALFLSVAIQAAFVSLFIWLANTAGVQAPQAAWFFAWPLAKILAVLPISLGGIGLREATLAGLMSPFGADPSSVVAASLIWQTILIVTGVVGAVAWLTTSGKATDNLKSGRRKEI